jgi:hypothetical protein
VCLVDEPTLRIIREHTSIYSMALDAAETQTPLRDLVEHAATDERLDYDAIYDGRSDWRVLPAIDHPADPARLLVTGTGLTHRRSAEQRQAMHAADTKPTDSLRMYEWGVEGGRPAAGAIGTAPEWFYKGNGTLLRGHGDPLNVPGYADDGGEEPEIAGAYVVDGNGKPRRIGMAIGNEFSDHVLERRNYLYLAASKLRTSAIGPELVIDSMFDDVRGEVSVERDGKAIWSRDVHTGEAAMSHSLANLEHHHFKFEGHRRPGDVHVHYFGADAFSFGAGIALHDGDVMQVQFDGFGRALRNPVSIDRSPARLIDVRAL